MSEMCMCTGACRTERGCAAYPRGQRAGTYNPLLDKDFVRDFFHLPAATKRDAWECPRCHKINAPATAACDCKPPEKSA